jgi:hypothetical protein
MQRQSPKGKQELKSAYKGFINSAAGQDFLAQAQKLEKAYVLLGIKAQTSEEKAHALCKMEGVVAIRDYMLRMAK